ncbi:hypothetical protein BY458DRAFT_495050 [Sporodiniella umbellata]|nr:hypothetical protein BY458DRAFT_495050 [Sporodiniella umbellata]
MSESIEPADVVVDQVEEKGDKPFVVYNSMLASTDSLYDETAVTAPSTPCGSSFLASVGSQKTSEIRKKLVSISSNEESVPSLQNSDEHKSLTSDASEASAERMSAQDFCIQTVINSRSIPIEAIIQKIKQDIESGLYDDKKTDSKKKESEQPTQLKSNESQLSINNSQAFYSTTSTPKTARTSKRKSFMSSAIKKKNCIIL